MLNDAVDDEDALRVAELVSVALCDAVCVSLFDAVGVAVTGSVSVAESEFVNDNVPVSLLDALPVCDVDWLSESEDVSDVVSDKLADPVVVNEGV